MQFQCLHKRRADGRARQGTGTGHNPGTASLPRAAFSYPWLLLSYFLFLHDLTSIFSSSSLLSFFYPLLLTVSPVPPCRTARRPTSKHPQIRRGPFPQLLLSYARGFSEEALKIAVA